MVTQNQRYSWHIEFVLYVKTLRRIKGTKINIFFTSNFNDCAIWCFLLAREWRNVRHIFFLSVGCSYPWSGGRLSTQHGRLWRRKYNWSDAKYLTSEQIYSYILCFFSNLIHFCFPYIFTIFFLTIFSTCFGPAGPSSGESNYTCSIWHLSLLRCYLVRGRWC